MKLVYKFLLASILLLVISACNSSVDRFSLLKKCTVLGDESIVYARAHYVKLFYHFNPNKFADSFNQINNFDAVTHLNTIDTYSRAIEKIDVTKLKANDVVTRNMLSACKELSEFSVGFVENNYKQAFNHISKNDPLTDDFFNEINKLVKFDHNIGAFDKSETSFKQSVDHYQKTVNAYIKYYRKEIPTVFVNGRSAK